MRTLSLHTAALCALIGSSIAAAAEPVSFVLRDWELACDNTRTCRAAGYQPGDGGMPVSVLLTREAGPGAPVSAEVSFGDDWDESVFERMPQIFRVVFVIDGRRHGEIAIDRKTLAASLTPAQTTALLKALKRDSVIEFHNTDLVWTLSDAGASAVLLKMDEAQGRIDTPGALRKPGKRSETLVPPPLPMPIVRAVEPHPALPADKRFLAKHGTALRAELRRNVNEEDCIDLHGNERGEDETPQPLEIVRLTKTQLLVSTRCWMGAYNMGNGYWVINDKPPFRPLLVTQMANEFENGTLTGSHKGRGLGDCWNHQEWVWDGARFVHTASASTGMCRGFPGGAWRLPTLVTDVKR